MSSPFSHGNSLRKSFSRERPVGLKKHTCVFTDIRFLISRYQTYMSIVATYIFTRFCRMDVRTIEEAEKSGTDPEDEVTYADIPNVTEYRNIFQPTRACK